MKRENYFELNMKEIMILSYLNKNHCINYTDLQIELKMSLEEISYIIMDLYNKNYIYYNTEQCKRKAIYVNDKVNTSLIDGWNSWTLDYKDEKSHFNNFEEVLYIPKNFGKI